MQMENDYNLLTRMKNSSSLKIKVHKFVKNVESYLKKKYVLWDPFNLKVYLVGDFFCLAWIGSATMLPTQI